MSECHRTMVREILFYEHIAVEASHLFDGKYTDAAERPGSNRKYFTLCHISPELRIRCRLKPEECDVTGNDIALKSSVGHFNRKRPCHDHLVLHLLEGKLGRAGISAVEAHESIRMLIIEFSFDGFLIHILGHRVVDVKQSNRIF